tara:strand:- start:3739 stop:5004 length:1266 start_codon:yes stop_codon:yes gene_type:complete
MIISYLLLNISSLKPIEKESGILVPVKANFILQIHDLSLLKQFMISELYCKRASDLLKSVMTIDMDKHQVDATNSLGFLDLYASRDYRSGAPIEFLQIEIKGEMYSFLRTKGKMPNKGTAIIASNNGYLYLLLNNDSVNEKTLYSAINNTVRLKLKEPKNFINLYMKTHDKWAISSSIVINKKKIYLKYFHPKDTKNLGLSLKPNGLHMRIPNSAYKAFDSTSLDFQIKEFSGNFLGWEENKVIMPVFDCAITLTKNLPIDESLTRLAKTIDRYMPQLKDNYSWTIDSGHSFNMLLFGQFNLYSKKINNETWFISTTKKKEAVFIKSTSDFQIKGDPSLLLSFQKLGWKGRLISEYLENSLALKMIKTFISNLNSVKTISEPDCTKIELSLKGNQEVMGFLNGLMVNEIETRESKIENNLN